MQFDLAGHAIGNVTRDPELRFLESSGEAVCSFGIAINHQRKRRDGQGYDDTGVTFVDVTCWRGLAEHVAETITRGMRVWAVGTMETEDYEDREGNPRSSFKLTADDCGPSLLWATAEVTKAEKGSGGGGGQRPQQRGNGGARGGGRPQQQRGGGKQRAASGRPPADDYDEAPF